MTDLRGTLRRGRAEWLEWTGANRRARARLDGRCAAILTYHRVLPPEAAARQAVEPGMWVAPDTFARHLDWLREAYRVLPLVEVVERLEAGRPLPEGACALSFDDGWRDNLEHALPALRARGLPATLFVVTDRVGTPGAFWPDEVARRLARVPAGRRAEVAASVGARPGGDPVSAVLDTLKALPHDRLDSALEQLRRLVPDDGEAPARTLCSWEELAELARGGFAIESHAATHALLTRLPPEAAAAELRRARESLRERGFGGGGLLAYPSGAHDATVRRLAAEAGHRAAVTTERGLASAAHERLALPRIGLHQDVSASRAEFRRAVPGFGLP